jgi:hypothetical protein
MKNKLAIIFDSHNEILGIEKHSLFNNTLDAEDYFLASNKITSVRFEDDWMNFKTSAGWNGSAKIYWVKDFS